MNMYMYFVDLKAAYDRVSRYKLFDVLCGNMGINEGIFKCLIAYGRFIKVFMVVLAWAVTLLKGLKFRLV